MAIIRTTEIEIHLEKLERNFLELKEIIKGTEPNQNIWDQYSLNPDDYRRDFIEINLTRLDYAIDSYKSSLAQLAKLRNRQASRRASNK